MRARLRTLITVGALVVAGGVSACGGGDDPPAVSPPVSVTDNTPTIQTTLVRTEQTLPGDVDAGRTIFEQTCQACHPAGGSEAGTGPKLVEAGFTPDQIREQIVRPRQAMPPNLVSGADLDDVTAYVAGLQ